MNNSQDCGKTQIGTPFYMAPELFRNQPYDHTRFNIQFFYSFLTSDMWGIGCILFELLEGNHAFDGEAIQTLAMKIMRGEHSQFKALISEELKGLVRRLLSQTPSERFIYRININLLMN
jgi:NIMA (never in mitosis gene a)-related kinase